MLHLSKNQCPYSVQFCTVLKETRLWTPLAFCGGPWILSIRVLEIDYNNETKREKWVITYFTEDIQQSNL